MFRLTYEIFKKSDMLSLTESEFRNIRYETKLYNETKVVLKFRFIYICKWNQYSVWNKNTLKVEENDWVIMEWEPDIGMGTRQRNDLGMYPLTAARIGMQRRQHTKRWKIFFA